MKLFRIRKDQLRKKAGDIEGIHKWNLPGVVCLVCNNTWSAVGLEYPSVDFTHFVDESEYRNPRSVRLEVFLELQKKIANAFPKLSILEPGAEFGALLGKAVGGRLDGFVWRSWWTICLEEGALQKLKDSNLSLPYSVEAEIAFKNSAQKVFEFDLPLKGKLLNGVYEDDQLNYCDACGRDSASLPKEILIEEASIPIEFDIFRVSNFKTIILVSERFVDTVNKSEIKGAIFEEVKIV